LRAGKYGGGVVLTLLLGLLSAGCSSKGEVSGQVLYQGKPLPGGTVTLVTPNQGAFSNRISPEGRYTIYKVPVGKVKIAVQPPRPREGNPVMQAMMRDAKKKMSPEEFEKMPPRLKAKIESSTPAAAGSAVAIPTQYSDPEKSGLELTVTGGKQTHDIELK
jgi:hypothetical protein